MRRCRLYWVFLLLVALGLGCSTALAATYVPSTGLRLGERGPEVLLLQDYLARLGYIPLYGDGIFGPQTDEAVRKFQENEGLEADGIVGRETWKRLKWRQGNGLTSVTVSEGDTLWDISRYHNVSVRDVMEINHLADPAQLQVGQVITLPVFGLREQAELVLWAEASKIYSNFATATVTDVETGLSFEVRRYYGHYHADSEPLTYRDTAVLKQIYGGRFSWDRRAIVVSVGGRKMAASMNGWPHGGSSIKNNGFNGHICIHFLGSRLHLDGTIHRSHQEMVLKAAGYDNFKLWFNGDRTP